MILTGVDHVESADPERYRGGEQQNPRIERPANRNPRGSRSNAERKSEKQMRPARESFAVGIQKYHRQRHRRKHQRQAVQLGSGKHKNSASHQNECANKRRRQLSDRQSASSSAGIGGVNRGVGQAIEGHSGGPRRDHGHDDPPQLPPRRQTSSRQHGSAERKREREDRVLPFNHLQRDLKISEQAHGLIVKQRSVGSGQWPVARKTTGARYHKQLTTDH